MSEKKEMKEWDKYSSDEDEKSKENTQKKNKRKNKKKMNTIKEEIKMEYTDKEKTYLNKFLKMAKNSMDENEVYQLIINSNFNDDKIENEIKNKLKFKAAAYNKQNPREKTSLLKGL